MAHKGEGSLNNDNFLAHSSQCYSVLLFGVSLYPVSMGLTLIGRVTVYDCHDNVLGRGPFRKVAFEGEGGLNNNNFLGHSF